MRITRQMLLKIAREAVNERARAGRGLLAAYLHGSVLDGDPVLGGTADVDLVLIHNGDVPTEREIVRLTDEVHLDITHHTRRRFHQPRALRKDPRLGPSVYAGRILHDPQHFLDFTQASVRGHFHRPDNVFARAQRLAESARGIWLAFYQDEPEPGPEAVAGYLRAVENVGNALASLNGPPLPERRLLLLFPERAEALGRPGLNLGLLGLLGGNSVETDTLRAWLPAWAEAFERAGENPGCPPALHAHRRAYYLRALEALLESDQPLTALWPLLSTWTLAVCHLPADGPCSEAWREAFEHLTVFGPQFSERVAALDAYLDTAEETLEVWARENAV